IALPLLKTTFTAPREIFEAQSQSLTSPTSRARRPDVLTLESKGFALTMATRKQVAANRRNAAQSTGPRSVEGKARSAANSMKHGIYASREIIQGEKLSDRQALEALYFERWKPSTPEQVMQVRILIRCDWEDTRYSKATAQLWDYAISKLWQPAEE